MVDTTVSSILSDVEGIRVGHYTDADARTGLTVIVFDDLALTAAEVRGAAPGSLNLAMLQPGMTSQRVDAILLTGGSSYGLGASDGVMHALKDAGRGIPFGSTVVPLVAGAVIFDLGVGEVAFPDAVNAREAFATAGPLSTIASGRVGVGTGARLGSIGGLDHARSGGFGVAQIRLSLGTITAMAVVNALGATVEETTGGGGEDPRLTYLNRLGFIEAPNEGQNTTLMAIVTDIPCTHQVLGRCCVAAHDALARTIVPAHTAFDGDIAFASTTKTGEIDRDSGLALTLASELVMEQALRNAATIPEL